MNGNTKTLCKICSKLTKKTLEWRHFGGFIVDFEHFSHLFSAQVDTGWDSTSYLIKTDLEWQGIEVFSTFNSIMAEVSIIQKPVH